MQRLPRRLPSLPLAAALAALLAATGCHRATPAEQAAAPIVAKAVAARGGLKAWQGVQALAFTGQLEAGRPRDQLKLAEGYLRQRTQTKGQARLAALAHARGADEVPAVRLPFTMELARPRRSRLEVRFEGQTAVQVYDGTKGWKVRPFLGRREVEPFTPVELQLAGQQTGLEGPLLAAAAAGDPIELEGKELVDGREAYRLRIASGKDRVRRVWVDAETYLDVKVEDGTRRVDGVARTAWTTYRDFQPVDGLVIPRTLETSVAGVNGAEKIQVEKVTVNPKLADARFTRPD